jgi:hypothetical protein
MCKVIILTTESTFLTKLEVLNFKVQRTKITL